MKRDPWIFAWAAMSVLAAVLLWAVLVLEMLSGILNH